MEKNNVNLLQTRASLNRAPNMARYILLLMIGLTMFGGSLLYIVSHRF